MTYTVRSIVEPAKYTVTKTLSEGPLKLNGASLVTFDLDGDSSPDEGAYIGVALPHAQFYAAEIKITNTGTDGGLAGLTFADRIPDWLQLSADGEDGADGVIDSDCGSSACDGVAVDNANCTATVSGPPGKKGAIDPRFVAIEADALLGGEMCVITLYLETVLVSKAKGQIPAVYAPERCDIGMNADGSSFVYPAPLNPGPTVIEDATGEVLSGPHDPIVLQVLGGCP